MLQHAVRVKTPIKQTTSFLTAKPIFLDQANLVSNQICAQLQLHRTLVFPPCPFGTKWIWVLLPAIILHKEA